MPSSTIQASAARRRRDEGVDHGERRVAVRLEVGAGVEAEPADPEQRGADHGERHRVRRHRLLRDSRRACRSGARRPAPAMPALMCTTVPPAKSMAPKARRCRPRRIGSRGSGRPRTRPCGRSGSRRSVTQRATKRSTRGELHPLGEGADDQRRRDAGEGHLEADEDEFRDDHAGGEGLDHRARASRRRGTALEKPPMKLFSEPPP